MDSSKLKTKSIVFGVLGIVSFILLVISFLFFTGEIQTEIDQDIFAIIVPACVLLTIVFLILFIIFIIKYKNAK